MAEADSGLKTEKLDRIREAAMKEFSEKGYEKASTAQICINAGVSKGLLFHHFGTKKGLYLELYDGIISDFMAEIDKITFEDCKTYLDTIVKTSNIKLKYFIEHPGVYEIALETNYRPPDELKDDIKRIFDKYVRMDNYFSEKVFEKYKFREGIDQSKAWEIVVAVTALVERKIMQKYDESRRNGRPFLDEIIIISDDLFEYFDLVFNGITIQTDNTVKRGQPGERDNDGKGRNKAV